MKLARTLGSIQLALIAGSIFITSLIIGTCLESWYSDKIAQELVYHTWWFTALLGLLALCIFFAAMKKWPWKKHQTGFLITHVGLLTLLAGGVLNSFFGVDAVMRLVDSSYAAEQTGADQKSRLIQMSNQMKVTLERQQPDKNGIKEWIKSSVVVNPGPLPWGSELGNSIVVSGLIKTLDLLANPLPRTVYYAPFDDVRLEMLAHLPHCRVEPLEAAKPKEFGFPAIKVEINTSETGRVKPTWTALSTDRDQNLMPYLSNTLRAGMLVELLGTIHPSLLDEFLKPPSDQDRGTQGTLIFNVAGKKFIVNVKREMGNVFPLGDTGWKVKLENYFAQPGSLDNNDEPSFPSVHCDVIAPDGAVTKYQIAGRIVDHPGPMRLDGLAPELDDGLPAVWYHAPDVRYGWHGEKDNKTGKAPPHIKSMLQFVQTYEGKLYYRSYHEQDGKMKLDDAGEAPAAGVGKKIWDSQAGNFIIEEHLPHAKRCTQRVVPVTKRPGLLDEAHPPSVLTRLILIKKDSQGKPQSFYTERWIPLGRRAIFTINGLLDGQKVTETFRISFGNVPVALNFALELTRAESQLDPGTNRAATYSSFVKIFNRPKDLNEEEIIAQLPPDATDDQREAAIVDRYTFVDSQMITMNEPLEYFGYKVYQSRFEKFGLDDETGKQLAGSVFTIGRDPGLWLKYLGTGMVGLGIATMFWMKAYFFKPKARQVSA